MSPQVAPTWMQDSPMAANNALVANTPSAVAKLAGGVSGWLEGVTKSSCNMGGGNAPRHARTAGSHAKTAHCWSSAAPLAKLARTHARRAPEKMAEVELAGEV